ncbi:MAG TPA: hypothetical protein VMF13_15005 [Luteitalea sp.]|nr:hypothetical protein [Luteitalea sp.]
MLTGGAVVRAATMQAAILLLTTAHHWYGAVRFETPWRMHVLHLAGWLGVAMAATLITGWMLRGRAGCIALGAFVVLSMTGAVGWLALYEGAYNHVLKGILFAMPLSTDTLRALYPPGLYEPPADWLFELSGIAQLPVGLLAGASAVRLWPAGRPTGS